MIIIDSKKDYYDYMVGINGRDEGVVFDRRNYQHLNKIYGIHSESPYLELKDPFIYFSYNKSKKDVPRTHHKKRTGKWYSRWMGKSQDKYAKEEYGMLLYCVVEIGLRQYYVEIDRYLDESDSVTIEPEIKKVEEITIEQKGERPVVGLYVWSIYDQVSWMKKPILTEFIIGDTWISSLVSPEEVYNSIYNYIIASKDKKIEDNRNDEQKAQSYGFNKESFRNPIRVKDLSKTYKRDKK